MSIDNNYPAGYAAGQTSGYNTGYAAGYAAGQIVGQAEGVAATKAIAKIQPGTIGFSVLTIDLPPYITWYGSGVDTNLYQYYWTIPTAGYTGYIFVNNDSWSAAAQGAVEPVWDFTPGAQTVDNEITWTCRAASYFTTGVNISDLVVGTVGGGVGNLITTQIDPVVASFWNVYVILNDDTELCYGTPLGWTTNDGATYYTDIYPASPYTTSKLIKRIEARLDFAGYAAYEPFEGCTAEINGLIGCLKF